MIEGQGAEVRRRARLQWLQHTIMMLCYAAVYEEGERTQTHIQTHTHTHSHKCFSCITRASFNKLRPSAPLRRTQENIKLSNVDVFARQRTEELRRLLPLRDTEQVEKRCSGSVWRSLKDQLGIVLEPFARMHPAHVPSGRS